MRPDGTVVYARRYDPCSERRFIDPAAAVVGSEGDVTLAGSASDRSDATLVRILPDGSLGFATFVGFNGQVALFSLDELPTTGSSLRRPPTETGHEGRGRDGARRPVPAVRIIWASPPPPA